MKVKLPCCEINKKDSDTSFECDQCECFFEKKENLDRHDREIHKVQFSGKRKLKCCKRNAKRRKEFHPISCQYCECVFRMKDDLNNHLSSVHKCAQCAVCRQYVLTEDIRAQHKIMHEEEKQKRLEEERKRMELVKQKQQKDDDLILNYVKTNKNLDEFPCEPDYEPDFHYIFRKHKLSKEELLKLALKFEQFNEFFGHYEPDHFTSEQIIYLLENDGISVDDVDGFLDDMTFYLGDDDIMDELVGYYLDKGYEIKREWVAKVINNDTLIERIKQKYTFTFREIYDARERDSISIYDERGWDEFYVQVHKHFPNPNFKDPFADPFEDFKRVANEHVRDHLHSRYFYDEEDDELSIVVNRDCEISLGKCKQMFQNNLEDLIKQYNEAIEEYDKANDEVSKLFAEREEELDRAETENDRLHVLDWTRDEIYGSAIPTRNYYANDVSKLYFVIAMKKSNTELYAEPKYFENKVFKFAPLLKSSNTEPTEVTESNKIIKTTKVMVPENLSFLKNKISQATQSQTTQSSANNVTSPANSSLWKFKTCEPPQCQPTKPLNESLDDT